MVSSMSKRIPASARRATSRLFSTSDSTCSAASGPIRASAADRSSPPEATASRWNASRCGASRSASLQAMVAPQALMADGQITRPRAQVDRLREIRQQRLGCEHACPGGREHDAQRQAVDAAAHLRHRGSVVVVELKVGRHRACGAHEELDGSRIGQPRAIRFRGWHLERRDGQLVFACEPQRLSTRGQDDQSRAGAEQLRQVGRGVQHVLEVVDQHQPGLLVDHLLHTRLERRSGTGTLRDAERSRHRRQHVRRCGDDGEIHENATWSAKSALQSFSSGQREPRLPTPPGPVSVISLAPSPIRAEQCSPAAPTPNQRQQRMREEAPSRTRACQPILDPNACN